MDIDIEISKLADQYYAQCWTVVEEYSMQWQVNKPHSNSRNDNDGDEDNCLVRKKVDS